MFSSQDKLAKGIFRYTSQVFTVFNIFNTFNKYSPPKITLTSVAAFIDKFDIEEVNKALAIYRRKTQIDKKAPHPNYFKMTVKSLSEKPKTIDNDSLLRNNLGKLI